MPLTEKGEHILRSMENTYSSPKKAKQVFYASKNAGKISGVDARSDEEDFDPRHHTAGPMTMTRIMEAVEELASRADGIKCRYDAYCERRDDAESKGKEEDKDFAKEFAERKMSWAEAMKAAIEQDRKNLEKDRARLSLEKKKESK